mmetsp:Transcript_26223/g.26122  ORF Transcript_26223/g.26122 Transcript_26223/m.26122 type:complete len:150 (+) Transcript_26223:1153-1602(+)
MDKIGAEALNSKWVSVPRGSEYFSFHQRNSSEETLFMVEDERYEVDAYLNMTNSTIGALKRLETQFKSLNEEEQKSMTEEQVTALRSRYMKPPHMKWIKHIYNCTIEMAKSDSKYDFLNLNNLLVIPIIMERLQKLQKCWSDKKNDRQK